MILNLKIARTNFNVLVVIDKLIKYFIFIRNQLLRYIYINYWKFCECISVYFFNVLYFENRTKIKKLFYLYYEIE